MAQNKIHIKPENRGKLHRHLGIPEDQSIPVEKLKIKSDDSEEVRKMKQFALNASKWKKGHGGILLKYQEGGRIFNMQNGSTRRVLKDNLHLNFVQRMFNKNPREIYVDDSGLPSTHLMSYGEADGKYYVFPTVVEVDGQLKHIEDPMEAMDYAFRTKEFIEFDKEEDAAKFAEGNWKGMTKKAKEGRGLLYNQLKK